MTHSDVRLEVAAHVGTITIHRPAVRNALSQQAWEELAKHLTHLAGAYPAVRVVVVRGTGDRAFAAGADIGELTKVSRSQESSRSYVELMERVMKGLEQLPQPVIAAINGDAIGAGLELIAACDIRVARQGARFGIPASKLGLAATGQDLSRLERLIGLGHLKWLLLTARLVTAEVALNWSLIDALYPAADWADAVQTIAEEIAGNSAVSVSLAKRACARTAWWRESDEMGFDCSLPAWTSRSLAEGLQAFMEHRRPRFEDVESGEKAPS